MEAPRGDLAEDDAELARLEVVQAALDDVLTDDGNLALLLRVDAVDQHRQHIALVRQHALQFGERRRADHLAVPQRRVGDGLPVVRCAALMVACGTMPRIRVRISFWKPFITESTMIIASTPSARPIIEVSEMNEM